MRVGVDIALAPVASPQPAGNTSPTMPLRVVCTVSIAILLLVESTPASDVVDLAASLIGRPYVWGAEGPNTFDCSGLTQYVFREFALDLPRRAISQSKVGDRIGTGIERGDLLFFSSDAGGSLVTHVGIYEGRGRMIEASKRSGRVRRSEFDDGYLVQRFLFATRVLGNPQLARGGSNGRDEEVRVPSQPRRERKSAVRTAAARALEEFAGILVRRPRR